MIRRVTHLQRPGTNLTGCGEDGPFVFKTFDTEKVTCSKCRRRMPQKFNAPKPMSKTAGRMIQPGGGHRR